MQREEPYLPLTSSESPGDGGVPFGARVTGAAWLSSARVVRCWVKSRNERNPYPYLPAGQAGNSKETAGDKPEEGGDEVKSSWPLSWWATNVLQWALQRAANPRGGANPKKALVVRIGVCNSTP